MRDTYTLTQIANELKTNKTRITRAIDSLGIQAINEHTRKHANSPKLYDYKAKTIIINHLTSETGSTTKAQHEQHMSNTRVEHEQRKEELVELLKRENYNIYKQLEEAQHEKKELIKALQEAQQLVSQQQQLSLQANKKLEQLEYKLEQAEEEAENVDPEEGKVEEVEQVQDESTPTNKPLRNIFNLFKKQK